MQEKEIKTPNEYGIINPQPEKCNHKIKSKGTSVVLLEGQRTFTFPEHVYGICKYCGKPFHYVRNPDGTLSQYKENHKGENE